MLRALREVPEERRRPVRLICRDIGPETRKRLAGGSIAAALCHPLERTSDQLIQTMLDALGPPENGVTLQITVPFTIVTPENLQGVGIGFRGHAAGRRRGLLPPRRTPTGRFVPPVSRAGRPVRGRGRASLTLQAAPGAGPRGS